MANLQLCTSCRRHVRADASACPFCAAAISASIPDDPKETPRLARGALMSLASAGFAATLGACYGAPARYHEPLPPPQGDPQLVDVGGDAHGAARRAVSQARRQGCNVYSGEGDAADIVCGDWSARAIPTAQGIQLYCREPSDGCRTGYEKLLAPEPVSPPPVEPIPPPP